MQEVYEDLQKKFPTLEMKRDEVMAKHTSFKVGGKADILIKVDVIEELRYILNYAQERDIPVTIIGNGSNLLIKDNGIRGITIKLDFNEIQIEENKDEVIIKVGAGVKLGMLAAILQRKEITGFEFASRNSRNHRWSNSYECRCLWERNERNSKRNYLYK